MLEVKHVSKFYHNGSFFSQTKQQILFDISMNVDKNESVGIIGESGSGKSTLSRQILGIEKPDAGEVLYYGKNVWNREVRAGHISAVFQDYYTSINPYMTVEQAVLEPVLRTKKLSKGERTKIVSELLEHVGLDSDYRTKYAHELSGGQAQRVCIARAISTEPEFIVLDEATSSLDASVQYQILMLLKQLKKEKKLSYLFITHDIQAAAFLCERILFFSGGRIIEEISTENLSEVKNKYSRKLLQATLSI